MSLSQRFCIQAENTAMTGSALGRQSPEHVRRACAYLQMLADTPIQTSQVPVAPDPRLSSIHKIARSFPFACRGPQEDLQRFCICLPRLDVLLLPWHGRRKPLSCSQSPWSNKWRIWTWRSFSVFHGHQKQSLCPTILKFLVLFTLLCRRGNFVPHSPGLLKCLLPADYSKNFVILSPDPKSF